MSMVETLPFIGPRKNARKAVNSPRDFWCNITMTGDYDKDCDIGSQYAYLALQAIKADNFAPLLGWIVMDMIANKCPRPIVLGFFQTVADVCLGYHQIPSADMLLDVPGAAS